MTLRMLFVLFAAMFFVGGIHAAKDPAATGTTEAKSEHDGHAHGEKEPIQKTFGLTRFDLGIWTLVVFGLLFFVLGKFAWKPMINGLDKRQENLQKIHDDALAARAESEKNLAEIKDRLAKANDEIRGMMDEARRDAQVLKDQMKSEALADIATERERVRKEIDLAKEQALLEIYTQSVEIAAIISSKAVQRELTPSDHARLLDESLAELKQTLSKA
ncbi:MAG: hypothetical protein R3B84_07565 [Zavarzinella sp.]